MASIIHQRVDGEFDRKPLGGRSARGEMDTKIIELRMAVRALPTSNRLVSLAVKSEVLRLSELLNSQYAAQQSVQWTGGSAPRPKHYPHLKFGCAI